MIETIDNIWRLYDAGATICIPVNVGWKRSGHAVMGRGLAREAALRITCLPDIWGHCCREKGPITPVTWFESLRIVMFPTKPLNTIEPHMSWDAMSDVTIIRRSCQQLRDLVKSTCYLPLPGCGAGRLTPDLVLPIVREELNDTSHILVHRKASFQKAPGNLNWLSSPSLRGAGKPHISTTFWRTAMYLGTAPDGSPSIFTTYEDAAKWAKQAPGRKIQRHDPTIVKSAPAHPPDRRALPSMHLYQDTIGPHDLGLALEADAVVCKPLVGSRSLTGIRASDITNEKPYRRTKTHRKHPDAKVASCEVCGRYIKIDRDAIEEERKDSDISIFFCLDCAGDEILAAADIKQPQLYLNPPPKLWGDYCHDRNEVAAAVLALIQKAIDDGAHLAVEIQTTVADLLRTALLEEATRNA